jgi:hypothetical protein
MQRENALDAHTKTDTPHRKSCAGCPAFFGDNHAFKRLETFLFFLPFAFFETDIYANGVARAELGKVFAQLRFM